MSSRSKSHNVPPNGLGGHGWRQAYRAGYGYGVHKSAQGWAFSSYARTRAQRMGYPVEPFVQGFLDGAYNVPSGVTHR